MNYVDPEGKAAILLPIIGGAIIGGGFELGAQLYMNDGRWECLDWNKVALEATWGGLYGMAGAHGIAARGLIVSERWFGQAARQALRNGLPNSRAAQSLKNRSGRTSYYKRKS